MFQRVFPDVLQSDFYARLSQEVLITPLLIPTMEESRGMISEMRRLRESGLLVAMRGGRETDIYRPLSMHQKAEMLRCAALTGFIRKLETRLQGTGLFLAAVKFEEARASTTSPSSDLCATYLHIDAEPSTFNEYQGPIYQFFLNLGQAPRYFRIAVTPVQEIMRQASSILGFPAGEIMPKTALQVFRQKYPLEVEDMKVPSGHLVIFDGRAFVHDAGKGQWREGVFEPSHEPDLVMRLDTLRTDFHTHYDPRISFLDRPA